MTMHGTEEGMETSAYRLGSSGLWVQAPLAAPASAASRAATSSTTAATRGGVAMVPVGRRPPAVRASQLCSDWCGAWWWSEATVMRGVPTAHCPLSPTLWPFIQCGEWLISCGLQLGKRLSSSYSTDRACFILQESQRELHYVIHLPSGLLQLQAGSIFNLSIHPFEC